MSKDWEGLPPIDPEALEAWRKQMPPSDYKHPPHVQALIDAEIEDEFRKRAAFYAPGNSTRQ